MNAMVVYGPQSSLPRYLNLNFTADFLRNSINLLEIAYHSVYSEGLNSYLEKFPFAANSNDKKRVSCAILI